MLNVFSFAFLSLFCYSYLILVLISCIYCVVCCALVLNTY